MLCLGDIQTWNYSARNIQIFCIDDGWQILWPSKPCLDVPEILKRLNQINWNLPVLMCSHSKLQALNMEVGGTSWQVNLPFKDYVACWLFSNDTNSQILFLTIECRYSFDTLWFFFIFYFFSSWSWALYNKNISSVRLRSLHLVRQSQSW